MGCSRKSDFYYYLATKRLLSIGLCAAMWFGTATNFEIPVQAQNQNTPRMTTSSISKREPGCVRSLWASARETAGQGGSFAAGSDMVLFVQRIAMGGS